MPRASQSGYPCLSLHGGKDQSDRECTITDFKSGVGNILIATSVAARGLDVRDLVLVGASGPVTEGQRLRGGRRGGRAARHHRARSSIAMGPATSRAAPTPTPPLTQPTHTHPTP
jgi:superfamily II DNA/RNA helicase